jgi:SAM-dependent methyltransferase
MSSAAGPGEGQREEWDLIAPGWKKWDSHLMRWLGPVGERMLDLARLKDGDFVLDVATGSGEPGLSAARRVGKGNVVGLDISRGMVDIAREKAKGLRINNYEARVYSSDFPFGPDTFDAVISRFGVMFFPDVLAGLREMARVLKPGGTLCVSVWGPQNEKAKSVIHVLNRTLGLPEPALGGPGPFRCSDSGKTVSLMRQAGFHDVGQVEVAVRRTHSSVGQYWEYLLDTNLVIADAFNKASEQTRKGVKLKVNEILDSTEEESGQLVFDSVALVSHGVR